MKLKILSIMAMFAFIHSSRAAGADCINEVKNVYKSFYYSLIKQKASQKGSFFTMVIEKNYYKDKKTEKDTVTYILTSSKRLKIYNRNFTIHSDGNNYVIIIPGLKTIGIQKITQHKQDSTMNPVEMINQMTEVMISEKNYQNCTEYTDSNKNKYRNLTVNASMSDTKYEPIDNMQFVIDITNNMMKSVVIRYKKFAELKEEKYSFSTVNIDYALPWDLLCPIQETIYTKDKRQKNEYKGYIIDDMRNKKPSGDYKNLFRKIR